MDKTLLAQNDWINGIPVFFNKQTGKVASRMNDVVDFSTFKWCPLGLALFMRYGYCVYGYTPVEHVFFFAGQ